MSEWISVNDRLPDNQDDVWVFNGNEVLHATYTQGTHYMEFVKYNTCCIVQNVEYWQLSSIDVDKPDPPKQSKAQFSMCCQDKMIDFAEGTSMTEQTCGNCRHFTPSGNNMSGECGKLKINKLHNVIVCNAPYVSGDYPTVSIDFGCNQWKEKKDCAYIVIWNFKEKELQLKYKHDKSKILGKMIGTCKGIPVYLPIILSNQLD